jgi:four helix bundle protein
MGMLRLGGVGRVCGMMPYERLEAWKAAHRLALEVYRVTDGWPQTERYELTSQLRRAALSIPSNMAEGLARRGPRELRRYLDISFGSLSEISYLLLFARERGLLALEEWESLEELRDRTGRLAWGLLRSAARAVTRTPCLHRAPGGPGAGGGRRAGPARVGPRGGRGLWAGRGRGGGGGAAPRVCAGRGGGPGGSWVPLAAQWGGG